MLCISEHNNEYKRRKNTQGGWAGGLLSYSGQLSVAICIGSPAGFGLGRWVAWKNLLFRMLCMLLSVLLGSIKQGG